MQFSQQYVFEVGCALNGSRLFINRHKTVVTTETFSYSKVMHYEEISSPDIDYTANSTIESNHSTPGNHQYNALSIIYSLFLFLLAGICEVGGGYLIWIGIREHRRPEVLVPIGSIILVVYGFIPTLQPIQSFGRIFAIYGGFFILLSYIWAVLFDNFKVDKGDIIGTAIAIAGVCVCWFWPRNMS